jgi:hypothetical protein
MSLYVALKAAVPILNALPKETYSALAKMAADMNPDIRRSLTGMLQSGLSEDETKSLAASVKRIDGKHKD